MIEVKNFNYAQSKVTGMWEPGKYPSESKESEWVLPDELRNDYSRLNSQIETKYSREYLKICAFYNKLFPALRSSGWITSSYNVPAFTAMEQERADTGTGISSNYLKQIVDQVVARIGTITFEPALIAEVPTLEYIVFKDEIERLMRKMIKNTKLTRMCTEIFHDAAILGFSHVFIDPVMHQPVKASDYEVGMYESQFTSNAVTQMLYRNYRFPVTSLAPYLIHCDDELRKKVVDEYESRDWCDFKMFFDCPGERVVITIGATTLPDIKYPFDKVQMVTFGWDVGFSKVTASSLFDLLYPTQRELNRVNSKLQQLIRMYKGPVPVLNSDLDLAVKAISNGTGEVLYIDGTRDINQLATVINPTPLDAQLNATKTEYKTEMYELAGLQQVSFDMENFRAAAAVVAMSQFNDTVFQAQMSGMAAFVAELFETQVHFNAVMTQESVWLYTDTLLKDSRVELKPVIATNPLGTKNTSEGNEEPDYIMIGINRAIINVIKGQLSYNSLPYAVNRTDVVNNAALTIVRLNALGIPIPDTLDQFMIDAFIDELTTGVIKL